jgi:lipopolysaccharide/colanic/teichoic acid biosynthesis glycosyltransferase
MRNCVIYSGHPVLQGEEKNAFKIWVGKSFQKNLLGKSRRNLEEDGDKFKMRLGVTIRVMWIDEIQNNV